MNTAPCVVPESEAPPLYPVFDRLRSAPGRFVSGRTIFFFAIESTGSSSFGNALHRAFEHHAARGAINPATSALTIPGQRNQAAAIELFSTLHRQRRFYHFIHGHWLYGAHRLWCHPASYITLLRDPVTRFLSMYNFYNHIMPPASRLSLTGYLDQLPTVCRSQTMQLAFENEKLKSLSRIPSEDEIFDLAVTNLERDFSFVGVTELFAESLFLFCDQFGLGELPPWQRLQATPNRPTLTGLSPELQDRIIEVTRLDQRLYDHYRARLVQCFSERDFGPHFERYKARTSVL